MKDRLRLIGLCLAGWVLRWRRTAPATASPPNAPRRILVIKPDHAGDLVLLTPALRVLRERWPTAEVTLLMGPWGRGLIAPPLVDRVHVLPFPGFTRQAKGRWWQPYWLLWCWASRLRAVHWDAALIARDDHWWGALLAALAGIERRIGWAVPGVAPLLTEALRHNPADHAASQGLALVAALTGAEITAPPATLLALTPAAQRWAAQRLGNVDARLVALHPGSGGAAKRWPVARWRRVAQLLEAEGWRVVVTGGPSEAALVAEIAHGLTAPVVVLDAPDLVHLGAVFARCAAVLGVDSGPLHVAAAVGPAKLALFGQGDVGRWGTWGDPARQRVVTSTLWCAPCGVLDHCPRGTLPAECMTHIPLGTVLAHVKMLLRDVDAARLIT